ncbi:MULTISPECIES: histidine kinase [unclassified Pedobacter]|uniref:histidine kinase n=1 Tax=unclassified Pedobacter TaxID=2628915 RepID=UPI001E50D469|nr:MULTISPECIES: histidine kinase [unclassified Pedobacter]
MTFDKKITYTFCLIFSFFLVSNCRNDEKKSKIEIGVAPVESNKKDYLALIISLDTLPSSSVKEVILKEDSLLNSSNGGEANPFIYYFKARRYVYDKKKDSALASYQKIKSTNPNSDVEFLKVSSIINLKIGGGVMVDPPLMSEIFSALKAAEQVKSKLTYRFYDLLAQAYFQNHEEKKSIEYAAIYYKLHPYNTHTVVSQRYFDISFLLASRLGDFKKMSLYNAKARALALKINDSLAIARTYDNEAQIYSKQLQTGKALASSKIFFDYLKRSNNLNDVAFNNLGTAFYQNKQPDSAIKYFRDGIALAKKDISGKQKAMHYNGLVDAFKMKGDFLHALEAADSAYLIELRSYKAIEAVKVAEMHEKYESEKKDINIAELNARNKLNETIIGQQRWTIFLTILVFVSALSFFYIFYRQQRLREKNKLLKSENKRLNVEQKMLQAQLNPHFIFNAIANLQSLIASGQNDESVQYLKSFSGLLRGILEQNRKDFIEIEDEICSLNNYLHLQQMRYTDAFDYKIIVDEHLDTQETLIPPMLIQPFVENSIEHGFRNLTYKGLLLISFTIKNEKLIIEIDDNGSGLKAKQNEKHNKQSLAQVILKERMDLLFTQNGENAYFKVKNKLGDAETGVHVEIQIPVTID